MNIEKAEEEMSVQVHPSTKFLLSRAECVREQRKTTSTPNGSSFSAGGHIREE